MSEKLDTIYLDLDGVLVNFDASFERIIGCKPANANRDAFHKNFARFVNGNGFRDAPRMPNAKTFFNELFNMCWTKQIDLFFLTSDGSVDEHREKVLQQKVEWLEINRMWIGSNKFILSHGWRGKADYAKRNAILIDDTERNVNRFVEHGGNAILYSDTSYLTTLNTLKEVF